jgi:hypothetical protein
MKFSCQECFDLGSYNMTISLDAQPQPQPHSTGVKEIDTNVEAKTVIVEADESVSPELMLEKLSKVRGKNQ